MLTILSITQVLYSNDTVAGHLNNVLDEVSEVLERHGLSGSTRLSVPHHPGRRDLSVFGLSDGKDRRTEEALGEIRSLTTIGTVSVGRADRAGVRFSDPCVEELGERLESGETSVLSTEGISPGRCLVVDFCDPNASKALHVGHLRNLALGQAVARIARACGATVTTTSQISDVGRSMAEAIAGYLTYADGDDPDSRGEKSDHFVGGYYSRYVHDEAADRAVGASQSVDPALSREDLEYRDRAATILTQLNRGDLEVIALRQKIRDWALEGHRETLERLQIDFDQWFLESEFIADIESIGDRLIEMGVVESAPNSVVFYDTGDSNYPHLVLRRTDGHSTQHLRYIALWHATRSALPCEESLQVMGDEWLHIGEYGDILLERLSEDGVIHPTNKLLHGMVSVDDNVVKSSGVSPWLIDELLDELVVSPEITELAAGDPEMANRLATVTALGFFLGYPPAKGLSLSRNVLFNPATNAGWAMALASLKAWDEQYDGAPDPLPADRAYRFLIAQSQVHRQLARRAYEESNPVRLTRLHMHLAQWFLATPCAPSVARVMRAISSVGLATLGLGSLSSSRV